MGIHEFLRRLDRSKQPILQTLILTKTKYIDSLKRILDGVTYGTIHNEHEWMNKSWGRIISYCYPRKITYPFLNNIIYNIHPAPIPEYRGGDPYEQGVKDRVTKWAVTVHIMSDEYDQGRIVRRVDFDLERPPTKNELWYVSHTYAYNLIKDLIMGNGIV